MQVTSTDVAIRHLRRERWRNRLALLAIWTLGPLAIYATTSWGAVCLGPFGLLLATALLVGTTHGAPIAGVRTRGRAGTVVVDDGGLTVTIAGRSRRFDRASIAAGWTEGFATFADDVVIQMTSGEIVRVRVDRPEHTRALLDAAGVAPHKRAISLRLGVAEPAGERVLAVFLALVIGVLLVASLAGALSFALRGGYGDGVSGVAAMIIVPVVGSAIAFVILLRRLITATLRIGTDGIAVERLFGNRFIPRRTFRGVAARGNELAIDGGGATTRLHVATSTEAETVAERIGQAMIEQDAAAEATQVQLDRGGRSIGDWLRAVRAQGAASTSYRIAKLDDDDLGRVLGDGAAPAERRIAAAAALARDDEGKTRVRIAAEACADAAPRRAAGGLRGRGGRRADPGGDRVKGCCGHPLGPLGRAEGPARTPAWTTAMPAARIGAQPDCGIRSPACSPRTPLMLGVLPEGARHWLAVSACLASAANTCVGVPARRGGQGSWRDG